MRVGVLFSANQSMGGVFQYSMSFINSLKRNKRINEINIYTYNKKFKLKGCNIVVINNYKLFYLLSIISGVLNFFPKFLFKENDIVFAPSYSPLLFFSKPKFVFTLHDLQELYYPEYFSKSVIFWRNFLNNKLTSKSFKVITESKYVKNDILKIFNLLNGKVIVIESPPFFEYKNHKTNFSDNKKQNSPLTSPYIFFPAQFWKHKNHIRVIEAFGLVKNIHPNIKMILTGSKSREYLKILEKIKNLKLNSEIILKGPINQDEMPRYFKNALLVIAPTLYESISIPVFEAFKYETPVCASGIFAIKDQVGDGGITFDPLDVNSISSSLIKIINDADLRKSLINNGKKRLSFFSDKRFNEQINIILNANKTN